MSHKDQTKLSPIRFFDRRMYRGLAVSMARSCVINGMLLADSSENVLTYHSYLLFNVRVHEKTHQPVGGGSHEDMNKMHSSIGVKCVSWKWKIPIRPLGIWADVADIYHHQCPWLYGMGLG